MASITLGGNPVNTVGSLPEIGNKAPEFYLTNTDMASKKLEDYAGKKVVMNIFPSVDTGVCATSVRKFNEKAASLNNTVVLCISRDLPFAQKRFCGAEGISNVEMLSDFKDASFGMNYGILMEDGKFAKLHARSVVVLNETGNVIHTELVPEIAQEPNYDAVYAVLG
ncbi:MAG: thiol peroxidase [Bacteroidota bacterium]